MENPILRGFNPDPSLCKGPNGYYIATSTFEWFPGVQVHFSKDLVEWNLVARPIDSARLANLTGIPDSCGIWAPCLSFADGRFWLCYTIVRRFDGNFKDTHNYLTSAPSIEGPWDDPVYMNSSGFDPSLFHDDDGRKWFVNMVWDHRPDRTFFGGIMLEEYDPASRRLMGGGRNIFLGSPHDGTEGPHLYKRDGFYYLVCAEGGTGYEHAVTVARSRTIEGPYEIDPSGHLLTAKDERDWPLQRAGHGSIMETDDGRLFLACLCSRPLKRLDSGLRSPMGRETALQQIWFRDGWFRTAPEGEDGAEVRPALDSSVGVGKRNNPLDCRYHFSSAGLPQDFQWLRVPDASQLFSLDAREGHLRLYGRESIGSTFVQALVARRQTEWDYDASVTVDFDPEDFQQWAGLVTYYNAHKFHYLYISHDPELGRCVDICSCSADMSQHLQFPMWTMRERLPEGPIRLGVRTRRERQQFVIGVDEASLRPIGPVLDASLLSDEAGKGEGANFTGNFIGMCAQDIRGTGRHADFSDFSYRTIPAPGRD